MSLNFRQKQEAKAIAEAKAITILDNNSFLVSSIKQTNSYEVQKINDKPYDYYCSCMGWKFSKVEKDCKHCEAIRLYLKAIKRGNRD